MISTLLSVKNHQCCRKGTNLIFVLSHFWWGYFAKFYSVLLNSLFLDFSPQERSCSFRGDGWRRPRRSGLLSCCGLQVGRAVLVQWSMSAECVCCIHTRALKAKDKAAPSAKPSARKKAMMAPAVSASCGATFLHTNTHTNASLGRLVSVHFTTGALNDLIYVM